MRTDIDGLDEAIKNELENWSNGELRRAVNESLEETAAAAAESLRRGGPYRERTGKYTKDWTHDQRGSRTSVITGLNGYSVYNKKHYQFNKKGILQKSTWVKRNGLYYRAGENGAVDMREGYNSKDPSTATRIIYKSSTIYVDLKKSWEYGTHYWTAHIKVKNTDQLRSSMAYGTYGGALETTSAALVRNNGIIGINGSRYDASGRPAFNAVLIRKGDVYKRQTSYPGWCA